MPDSQAGARLSWTETESWVVTLNFGNLYCPKSGTSADAASSIGTERVNSLALVRISRDSNRRRQLAFRHSRIRKIKLATPRVLTVRVFVPQTWHTMPWYVDSVVIALLPLSLQTFLPRVAVVSLVNSSSSVRIGPAVRVYILRYCPVVTVCC